MDAMRLSTLLLCLFLASVSAVGKLKNIDDLKNVGYGKPFPRHGLQLLFWFAQQVDRADQNVIHMNSDFNPKGNFGFHEFKNYEEILPNISIRGVQYYSVGNLNYKYPDKHKYPEGKKLPCYVRKYYNKEKPLNNMDRLMISVNPNSPKTVYSVYITAHINNSGEFDHDATYEIDSSLINNIKRINQPYDGKEECKRCYNFLKRTGYTGDVPFTVNSFCNQQLHSLTAGFQIEFSESIFCHDLEFDHFTTRINGFDAGLELYTEDGYACARLYIKKTFTNWQNDFYYSWVGFYKGPEEANDKYSTHQYAVKFQKGEEDNTKDYDIYEYQSSLAIAPGVQIRFLLDKNYNYVLAKTTPWAGPETEMMSPSDFDSLAPSNTDISSYGNAVIPVEIKGFDAGLRLYGEDGRASARLYIKKTFSDWQDYFSDSWVGFYKGKEIANGEYYTYRYVVHFEKEEGHLTDYDVFKYQSSLLIAPGVQIRFLLNKNLNTELARTLPWEAELI
ncbi:uncharacterized protein [Paramisgurnus dabryanus]|uniref:uncharacterized protein n=1 Tax=Paramisgurnus dabryanus TaxID=90735 RepID=UPI0031F43D6B